MVPLSVMTPSVQSFVAHTDNFSTTLLEGWKCEIHHSVYIHFKALIVDQGPKADIAIAVNCYIGKQQGHMKFRNSFESGAVDGVVMASLSNRKNPRSCNFFVGTVSGSVCTDGYAERKQNETRRSQHRRHGTVWKYQVVTRLSDAESLVPGRRLIQPSAVTLRSLQKSREGWKPVTKRRLHSPLSLSL